MVTFRHPVAAPRYDRLFDPGTAALVATGVGAAVSTGGTVLQASAASRQSKLQARVIEQQAARDRELNAVEVDRLNRTNSRLAAARRARLGATGVEAGTDSPLLIAENIAKESKFEELLAIAHGDTEFTRSTQQAAQVRAEGSSRRTALLLGAGAKAAKGTSSTVRVGKEFGVF